MIYIGEKVPFVEVLPHLFVFGRFQLCILNKVLVLQCLEVRVDVNTEQVRSFLYWYVFCWRLFLLGLVFDCFGLIARQLFLSHSIKIFVRFRELIFRLAIN